MRRIAQSPAQRFGEQSIEEEGPMKLTEIIGVPFGDWGRVFVGIWWGEKRRFEKSLNP
jgi:hypothetical protein